MMTPCVIAPADSLSLIPWPINMTVKSVFNHINGAPDTQQLHNNSSEQQKCITSAKLAGNIE